MNHLNAIPVDTHVFQIATKDYLHHLRACKTVTPKVYNEISEHFIKVFGEYAGWAHSVSIIKPNFNLLITLFFSKINIIVTYNFDIFM